MNKRNLYLGTLRSDNTKKSYGKDLKNMLGYINKDEEDITLPDLLDWVNHMKEKGNSTIGYCKITSCAKLHELYGAYKSDKDMRGECYDKN